MVHFHLWCSLQLGDMGPRATTVHKGIAPSFVSHAHLCSLFYSVPCFSRYVLRTKKIRIIMAINHLRGRSVTALNKVKFIGNS